GPGEFKSSVNLVLMTDNRMYVFNRGNHRIEVLSLNGDYIESIRMQILNSPVMRLDSGSYVKVSGQRSFEPLQDDQLNTLIHIYDSQGTEINAFGKMRRYDDGNMSAYGNHAWLAHDYDENIFTAMTYQNRIEKYSTNGELLLKISRQLPYEEGIIMINREDNSRAPGFARSITLDEKGRIWVQTFAAQITPEDYEKENPSQLINTMLEVFDETGVLITRIKVNPPGDYIMRLIRNNHIYFTSSTINMDVKIYEIIEK
ncbi:hypothetical protein IIB79_09945, partial [candidate division KSB1 bacterium]|nr:hypothetical protein [candidate division KSB1 bacterium]